MKEKKKLFVWEKQRAAAALAVTAALFAVTMFTVSCSGSGGAAVFLCLALGIAAGFFVLLDVHIGKIGTALLCVVIPFCSFWAMENYSYVIGDPLHPIIVWNWMILVLNLVFFYLLYALCTFLFGSVRMGVLTATLVPMIFGLANYFVVCFRGTPIVPWDLLSLRTAASVADNYSFELTWKVTYSIFAFIWMILLASKSTVRFRRPAVRAVTAAVAVALMALYVGNIQKSSVQSYFGMDTTLFTMNVLYRNNGIIGGFLGNLRFLDIEEPDDYSVAKAEELAAQAEAEADTASVAAADNGRDYPNIVIIMNEAFSDLSVWGEFETSEEVLPCFKKLQKEAIGGEVYVSVKGGNTANTEFELLTGDTMGFLPAGSVPYQQYIHEETPSLASYLKSLGYSTTAIHPYNRSGWDRDEVYEAFGFDEFLDRTSFSNPKTMRGYISDQSAFEKIAELFENKEAGERKFVFEVTMQNHGGYSKETPDFDSYIKLPGVEKKSTQALSVEKYLTLMNQTDRALEELVEYFRQQEEPVVLLMFGDHQPSDYITNYVKRLCGVGDSEDPAAIEQGYRVPFVIWSNYDLEPAYYEGISVNYLGGLLLEHAGIPKTGYQTFLAGLMESFPIVNSMVYRDADGSFHSWENGEIPEALIGYQILQYNHLVDTKHRVKGFYGE